MTPVGLKAPPKRAPDRLATTADIVKLQRLMTNVMVRPLTDDDGLQATWIDGRPMEEVASQFIKPNDRLTSFERLELYSRMYWFRILEAVREDSPGLRALLGEAAFDRLAQGYLAKYPSRSFTLRDLSSRLARFISEEPQFTAPRTALALEIARFEWAQTVAFDGEARPVVRMEQVAKTPPTRLRLALQPYLTLLEMNHPLDDWILKVKRRSALRTEASNAPGAEDRPMRAQRRHAPPKRGKVRLAVHRHDCLLYYKRLEPAAFRILSALQAGRTLAKAIEAAGPGVSAARVQKWFTDWMALGWLCAPH